MPFGLRNARETYQRLVDKASHKQIGRNLEVYVDDVVIKSRTEDEIVRDIEETFKTLREINMKLNPKKCTFGVEEGMFVGYKVNTKGLKVCPDKVDVVLSLQSLKCLKDVQKLNEKLASLKRFLAKSTEKSSPFFKTLKKCTKKSDFYWTAKAEEAFKKIKQLIAELPMLTSPMGKKRNLLSIWQQQKRRALRGPEINYTSMEKLVMALVLSRSKVAGRLQKWSIELGEYAIHYRPRVSFKGKILTDFIVERLEEESPDTLMEAEEELSEPWILFMDGSSCTDGSRAGLILTNLEGMEFTYARTLRFDATNNEAEYEALIAGLRIAKQMGKIEVLAVVEEEGDTWMNPIFEYLKEETLPADMKKARAVRRKSQRFAIINGTLYKKSFLGPWLRNPQHKLTPITSPWLFYNWGIGIARPFPEGPGKVTFLIVAINYFTKWIEAKPVATITGNQIKNFVWDNIVCRFGLLGEIISDNGNQFQDNPFKDWCEKLSVIPAEIGMPILRTAEVDLVQNNEALEINLDLLEEKREQVEIRDLVYRNNDATREKDTGNLGPKWEGSYKVTEALGKGAYRLRYHDGKQLPQTWNVSNLKKC
ncbi:reverse transcriptase domain-containing protein [Tanacetum coccineum]